MNAVPLDLTPVAVSGDKAYSGRPIREWLNAQRIVDVIPYKKNEAPPADHEFDREAYRRRNVVERLIGWLKECRRVATRYEKRGKHFLAMVKIAVIRRLVKTRSGPVASAR
jgi:transposase